MKQVFAGLGGNIGDSHAILRSALDALEATEGIYDLKTSSFYETRPVSDLPQRNYLNAVCRFDTTLTVWQLLFAVQKIEKALGKETKPKNAPRVVDIDILFYGQEFYASEELTIPHPAWRSRLFVLVPLAELTEKVMVPDALGNTQLVNVRDLLTQLGVAPCVTDTVTDTVTDPKSVTS